MNVHPLPQRLADMVEEHTDLVDTADIVNAYEAMLPVTEGDQQAAATLATGAVLAEAIQRLRR